MKRALLILLALTLFFASFLCENSSPSKKTNNPSQTETSDTIPKEDETFKSKDSERIVYVYDESHSYVTEIHFYEKNSLIKKVNLYDLNPYNSLELEKDVTTELLYNNYSLASADKDIYKSLFPNDHKCLPSSINSSSEVYQKGNSFTCIAFRCYLYSNNFVIDQKSTIYIFNSLGEVVKVFKDLKTHASLPSVNIDGTYLIFSYTDFKDCKAMPSEKGYYIYSIETSKKIISDNTEGISYAYLIDDNMVMATKKNRQKKIKEYKFYDLKNKILYQGALPKDIYSNIIRFENDKIILKEKKKTREKKYTDFFEAKNF